MNSQDKSQDGIYEKLYDVILKAITSSDEVKQALLDLKSKDLVSNMAVLNLILSLDELSDLIEFNSSRYPNKLEPRGRDIQNPDEAEQQEPCHEPFDQALWLKKARIRL